MSDVDTNDYPAEEDLAKIKSWPAADLAGLMTFVRGLWSYATWGWTEEPDGVFRVSTAGWSGNEDIIAALQENVVFWTLCWHSSRRGGHFEFRLTGAKS